MSKLPKYGQKQRFFRSFFAFFEFFQFWLNISASNCQNLIWHEIFDLLTPLTPLGARPQCLKQKLTASDTVLLGLTYWGHFWLLQPSGPFRSVDFHNIFFTTLQIFCLLMYTANVHEAFSFRLTNSSHSIHIVSHNVARIPLTLWGTSLNEFSKVLSIASYSTGIPPPKK